MTEKPRIVVVDTNIMMSAILFRNSAPGRVMEQVFTHAVVLSSSATRNELRDVMGRPKFDRYIALTERQQAVEDIIDDMIDVRITERVEICRDVGDNKILELALNGKADFIITGDRDLLTLHPFRDIRIITPLAYLEL